MKVLSNLEFKNSTYILNKFEDFPENTSEGTVIFKENGLYIYSTNITSGNLEWLNILDFTRTNTSYKFEQSSESTEWTITHNLNTQDLFVIVYDSDGNKQVESEIQFQSDNEIKLIFSESISGKALLFGASVVSSPSNIYTKEEIDELLKNIDTSGCNSNIILPENGVDGQVLIKDSSTESGLNWSDQNKTEYPSNGSNGQVLIHDDTTEIGAKWGLIQAPHSMSIGDMGYTYSDNPPSNALFCGGLVSKTQYPELYSIIGDKFTSDNALISKDKLIVPEWSLSQQSSVIGPITKDLTLGNNSYISAVMNDNIKITTYGPHGGCVTNGIYEDGYTYNYNAYGWYAFNTDTFMTNNYSGLWGTFSTGTYTLEIEYLDGSKFAPYMYGIDRSGTNYYYFSSWNFQAYDEESSTWITLDEHNDGSTTKPSYTSLQYFNINDYDNTKVYNKFRLQLVAANYGQIEYFRIYGTKEGEDSIYDLFALPPSVEDTAGAKNYIVATSGNDRDYNFTTEERVIGTWIDGKPIYRKVFTGTRSTSPVNLTSEGHYNEIINYYGYFINDQEKLPIHMPYNNNTNFIIVTINNNNIRLEQYGYASGTDYKIVIEYTKTI